LYFNLSVNFSETNNDDVGFNFSPLYWISGVLMFSVSLGTGMKKIITNKLFNPEFTLHMIQKHKITMYLAPPAHIRSVIRLAKQRSANIKSVRMIVTGAAVASDYLLNSIKSLIPKARIINSYGMTEAGGICLTELGVGGKVAKNIKIKVIDGNGNALGPNEKGLIMVYPEFKFLGYCNAPEKSEEIYIDGWVDTGDFGYINEKEDVFVLDRAKELIKCGKEMICLSEVEAAMEKIECLAESCVIGIPDEEHTNVLAALVVKIPGNRLTEREIIKTAEGEF
jgi:acyl-coenzyme A synthetase/AMP-(fatty) acid ligase